METVLIFAGGESPATPLAEELPTADLVVAADSGYDLAVSHGYAVDVLVGDMDSIETEVIPGHVIVERHPVDKDRTDLEIALAKVVVESPERVVVVGGSGGRIDHELAVAALVTSERWARIGEIDWVTSRGWAYVVRGRRIIHGDVGDVISLLAMGGTAGGVTTRGLRWNLSDADLHHGMTLGVSNVFDGPIADIKVDEGCLLVVVPHPDQGT